MEQADSDPSTTVTTNSHHKGKKSFIPKDSKTNPTSVTTYISPPIPIPISNLSQNKTIIH